MSDDRKIELTLDDLADFNRNMRESARRAAQSGLPYTANLLNLIADKVEALPKPRMAEPKRLGSVVTAGVQRYYPKLLTIPPSARTDFVCADPGQPLAWFSPPAGWAAWDDLIDPEPLP